jgi:protoporphyrinogen oxidase
MKNKVVILGAGPCGLSLGYFLSKKFRVKILEKNAYVGGISASKKYENMYYDLGSHRFLPSFNGRPLAFLKKFTKKDLQKNERKGLIKLHGKWLKYPLRIFDAYKVNPLKSFTWIFSNIYYKFLFIFKSYNNTSEHAFLKSFGNAFTKDFYKPFFVKVFGRDLKLLSDEQFRRRVSAGSLISIIKKSFANFFNKDSNYYYYTQKGIGQIYKTIESKVLKKNILKSINIKEINLKKKEITFSNKKIKYNHIVSTIPLDQLVKITKPNPPTHIKKSSTYLKYRSIVLPYFVIKGQNMFDSETLYFPEKKYMFNRLYFPSSYYKDKKNNNLPKKYLVGLEVTCDFNDKIWKMKKNQLMNTLLQNLNELKIFDKNQVIDFFVHKEKYAYPIYLKDYMYHLNSIKDYYYSNGVMLNGRQGLFLHNNQHHSIEMAYYASKALISSKKPNFYWKNIERKFDEYKVTD